MHHWCKNHKYINMPKNIHFYFNTSLVLRMSLIKLSKVFEEGSGTKGIHRHKIESFETRG